MTKTAEAFLVLFFLLTMTTQVVNVFCQTDAPHLVKGSTNLLSSTILPSQVTELNITIANPLNESTSVNVTVIVSNIECFPSNTSQIFLTASAPNATTSTKAITVVLTPKASGDFPIEVQLWWNKTQVDSKVFILTVRPPMAADLWGFWIRINILIWGLIFLIITTHYWNPSWKPTTYNQQTKKIEEFPKAVPFLIVSFFIGMAAFYFSSNYDNYYSFVLFLASLQGRIEPYLAAGWVLGVLSLAFFLFKRYEWSTSFSRLLSLMLLLLFVFDWFAIPSPPFYGWESIFLVIASVILNVLCEMGLKGLIEEIRKRTRKT